MKRSSIVSLNMFYWFTLSNESSMMPMAYVDLKAFKSTIKWAVTTLSTA